MTKSIPLRNSDIRERNEKMILSMIRNKDGFSQSEVVTTTGLKAPTVLRAFSNLENLGLIESFEKKIDSSDKKGRKPVFYRVKADALFTVGMEFWSGGASFTIEDFNKNILIDELCPIKKGMDWESVIYYMEEKVEQVIQLAKIPRDRILGLGIGVPGQVDVQSGEVVHYSRFDNYKTVNIKSLYEERLGLDVTVCNNTAAVAYGEHFFGRTGAYDSVFSFLMRGGVGGAFINKGEAFATNDRMSIEVGHMSVDYNGRKCECGNMGCLEAYISEKAVLADLGQDYSSPSLEELNQTMDLALDIASPEVKKILDDKALALSQAIRNLASVLAPRLFVVISRNEKLANYLAAQAQEYLKINMSNRWQSEISVMPLLYEASSGSRGAAELVFSNFLK